MKKIITVLFLMSSFVFGQNGFFQLNFESSGGYTTSISEFSDGGQDYFLRTDGTDIASESFSNVEGTYYFAAQDIDGEGASLPVTLELTNIDISGNTGLEFGIFLAEDEAADKNDDWDDNDYVHILYNVDGSGWNNLIWIENDGSQYNSKALIDNDFDGTGDGTALTSTFTEFTASIPTTGSQMDIKIEFYLNSGEEDVAIDNIRIGSNETPLPVELTTFSASMIDNNVELNWETATEVNNYGFEIERAMALLSMTWDKVGFVEGHGNSNAPKYYSFIDNTVETSGKYNYRLKQIDIDGSFEYSDVVEVNFGTPENFELNQNYPNPFNPTTSIQFNLPRDSQVKLSVFNILGEEVAELLNGNIAAGYHNVAFNASELNSGIYFYKLETGNFSQIRKMMLVK